MRLMGNADNEIEDAISFRLLILENKKWKKGK
jgi:hypothetical protein